MEGFDTQTVIAVIALLTGLGFIFNTLLKPVKKDIAKMESDIATFKTEVKADIATVKADIATLESKIDQLIARKN